jgi:mono/diheme cytochrome c family protein
MRRLGIAMTIAMASQVAFAQAADGLPTLDPSSVASGRKVYQQYCASCHGAHAEGAPNWQQRDAHGEMPAPPHNADGHTWRHSDAMLYDMISKGLRDPFNKTTRLTMPAFAAVLSPERIRAVITYLKTLWTPEERQFQAEENRDHPTPKP